MKVKFILVAMVISTLLIGCKPSVERETKNWQRNKSAVASLKSQYPQFAKFLAEDEKNATNAWNAAQKESGEETKAKAMDAANDLLETKLFRQLNSIKSRNDSINSGIKALTRKTMSKSKVRKVNRLISQARTKQSESRRLLRTANVSSRSAAQSAIDDAVGKLISANSNVSSAKKAAKK